MKSNLFWNKILITSLLPLFLAFTFFVFGPLEIYLTNTASFWFSIDDILPVVICSFAIVWVLATGLGLLLRNCVIFNSLVFGFSLALYIQGNWMFVDYGVMDGAAIDWTSYGSWSYINIGIWLVIILLPFAFSLFIKNKDSFKLILRCISLGIVGIECITLCILILTTSLPNNNYYVAKDDKMFELSTSDNIVVMLFDAFQSSYFQEAIDEIPGARDVFDGFVFYDSAVGTSLFTQESSATILTGKQFRVDLPFDENLDYIYNESEFLPLLAEKKYDVRYYESTEMVSPIAAPIIKNIVMEKPRPSSVYDLTKMINRITAFRYMPHFLKNDFWFSYNDIEKLQSNNMEYSEFVNSDYTFNQNILDGKLTASNEDKVYRMYYFKGVHPPYDLNENAEHVTYGSEEAFSTVWFGSISDSEMLHQQALGSVRIMMNYIQELKDLGVYDETFIVIAADHGWANRYNPILLIKQRNSSGGMQTSHAPISFIEDFGPTIMRAIDPDYQGAKTVFDYTEEDERERYYYIYDFNIADRSYNALDIYAIRKNPVIGSNFYKYYPLESLKYNLGEEIIFTKENDGTKFFINGGVTEIVSDETDFTWSLNKHNQMYLNFSEDFIDTFDVTANFDFKWVLAGQQHLIIKADDHVLYDGIVSKDSPHIQFEIPYYCINDRILILDFDYPDAVTPASLGGSNDTRVLGLGFQKIVFTQKEKDYFAYSLGNDINFATDKEARRFFGSYVSNVEPDFAWSLGDEGHMSLFINNLPAYSADLHAAFDFKFVYGGSQRLVVKAGERTLYAGSVTQAFPHVEFDIPFECLDGDILSLEFDYPDAASPASMGESNDSRILALAFEKINITQTNKEQILYRLGDSIGFTNNDDGRRFFASGISILEEDFAWSLGNNSRINIFLDNKQITNLSAKFNFKWVYSGHQHIIVKSNGDILYDGIITQAFPELVFDIPASCINDGLLKLDFEYPDAKSPVSMGDGNDQRLLAVAFQNISFNQQRE